IKSAVYKAGSASEIGLRCSIGTAPAVSPLGPFRVFGPCPKRPHGKQHGQPVLPNAYFGLLLHGASCWPWYRYGTHSSTVARHISVLAWRCPRYRGTRRGIRFLPAGDSGTVRHSSVPVVPGSACPTHWYARLRPSGPRRQPGYCFCWSHWAPGLRGNTGSPSWGPHTDFVGEQPHPIVKMSHDHGTFFVVSWSQSLSRTPRRPRRPPVRGIGAPVCSPTTTGAFSSSARRSFRLRETISGLGHGAKRSHQHDFL